MVDEVDEGRSYRSSPVKVDQVGAVHLKPQESADHVSGGVGKDRDVLNRDRVRSSWCCSLK